MATRTAGVKVEGERIKSMQLLLDEQTSAELDACQGIMNASNPESGAFTKVTTVHLAIKLLYKRLRGAHSAVKAAVKEVEVKAGRRPAKVKPTGQAAAGEPLVPVGMCDLGAIDDWVQEDRKNQEKAAAK